jgi:hypothetical protein
MNNRPRTSKKFEINVVIFRRRDVTAFREHRAPDVSTKHLRGFGSSRYELSDRSRNEFDSQKDDPRRKRHRCFTEQIFSYSGLNERFAERLPKINPCRTRLSPPTLHQHDNASTHQDKNDDDGKRFHRGQGLVPAVPKLKHARTSIESARPAPRKSRCIERTCLYEQKCNVTFRRARFDRAAT